MQSQRFEHQGALIILHLAIAIKVLHQWWRKLHPLPPKSKPTSRQARQARQASQAAQAPHLLSGRHQLPELGLGRLPVCEQRLGARAAGLGRVLRDEAAQLRLARGRDRALDRDDLRVDLRGGGGGGG